MDNIPQPAYNQEMASIQIHKRDGFRNEKMFIVPTDFLLRSWEHPIIKALHISDVGYFPHARYHYRERKKGIDESILIYCIDGSGVIELSLLKVELTRGTAFCIPAQEGHRYYASEENPWSILWVHFKGDNSALYPINEKKLIQIETPEDNNRLQTFFIQLLEIFNYNYTQGNFICASNLLSVILGEIYFREKKSSVDKQNQLLTKAIQFMYNKIDSTLTLADITGYMQFSKSCLSNLFKKHTRHSPVDFFIRLKIQQACKYLRLTDMRIYEIADRVGYQDQFYFSRIFKKVTGISPREYQNGKSVRNEALKIDHPEG